MKLIFSNALKRSNYLINKSEKLYHELANKLGLNDSTMQVLYTLCDIGDNCQIKDICYHSGTSKQTINSTLRKLEKDGYIYLRNINGKSKAVCLTESGKELINNSVRKIIDIENDIFSTWSEDELNNYYKLLEKYNLQLMERIKLMEEIK